MTQIKQQFSAVAGIGLPIPKNFSTLHTVQGQYIPFGGDGIGLRSDNNYPQILANLAANSPTHGGALLKKSLLTFGQGIDFEDMSESVLDKLNDINEDSETINDLLTKTSSDLVTYGGFAIKISWSLGKEIISMEHVPFKYVRLGRPVNGKVVDYIVSNDWEMKLHNELRHEYRINKFNPNKINPDSVELKDEEYRADEETEANAEQLIYFKTYCPASNGFYPLPDYISCLDSAFTEVEVGVSMLKGIENGINGSYIISTDETVVDDDSKQAIIDSLNSLSTGAANTGGLIFMPTSVKVDALEAIPADTYKEINPEIRQRIITAHGIPAILLEYSQGGAFNNRASELQAALEQFQLTTIKGYQHEIIRIYNSIMGWMFSEDIKLSILPFITPEVQGAVAVIEEPIIVEDESSLES